MNQGIVICGSGYRFEWKFGPFNVFKKLLEMELCLKQGERTWMLNSYFVK